MGLPSQAPWFASRLHRWVDDLGLAEGLIEFVAARQHQFLWHTIGRAVDRGNPCLTSNPLDGTGLVAACLQTASSLTLVLTVIVPYSRIGAMPLSAGDPYGAALSVAPASALFDSLSRVDAPMPS